MKVMTAASIAEAYRPHREQSVNHPGPQINNNGSNEGNITCVGSAGNVNIHYHYPPPTTARPNRGSSRYNVPTNAPQVSHFNNFSEDETSLKFPSALTKRNRMSFVRATNNRF